MNPNEILIEIKEIAHEQESSINSHGEKMVSMFKSFKPVVMRDAYVLWETNPSRSDLDQLSEEDNQAINAYLCVSSFISAWYHLAGLKSQRNKAANSCVELVSNIGFDHEDVFHRYITVERMWRNEFKEKNLQPKKSKLPYFILLLALCGVYFLL